MNCIQLMNRSGNFRSSKMKLVQAGALALMFAMAMSAMAGDSRPVKTKVPPTYPEIARRMHVGGTVRLEAAVDERGNVTDVKELSGNHTLALAAKEALMKWKFVPGDSGTSETVEISFNLGN